MVPKIWYRRETELLESECGGSVREEQGSVLSMCFQHLFN